VVRLYFFYLHANKKVHLSGTLLFNFFTRKILLKGATDGLQESHH
jgi:hypothetical protein